MLGNEKNSSFINIIALLYDNLFPKQATILIFFRLILSIGTGLRFFRAFAIPVPLGTTEVSPSDMTGQLCRLGQS